METDTRKRKVAFFPNPPDPFPTFLAALGYTAGCRRGALHVQGWSQVHWGDAQRRVSWQGAVDFWQERGLVRGTLQIGQAGESKQNTKEVKVRSCSIAVGQNAPRAVTQAIANKPPKRVISGSSDNVIACRCTVYLCAEILRLVEKTYTGAFEVGSSTPVCSV